MPVEEYLRTSFEGSDCDYVDGEVFERNMGEALHGTVQLILGAMLLALKQSLGTAAMSEIRIQINPRRYRVADLAVWRSAAEAGHAIPKVPPFLVVEILSPEDRMSRMVPKIRDYFDAGVEWIWLIDPYEKTALVYSKKDPAGNAATVLRTENPKIEIPVEAVFAT